MKKLIIFDCDGVLVDSEAIANTIEAAMLSEHGYPITAESNIKKFVGMNWTTVSDLIFQESNLRLPAHLPALSTQRVMQAFEEALQPLMLPVLNYLHYQEIARCVASSSPPDRVLKSLQLTEQDHFFDPQHIFTASQVKHGKPAPDLFLLAAQEMGFHPSQCLVIEDSLAGIQAAQNASMAVIGFLGGGHTQYDWYVQSLQALQIPLAYTAQDVLKYIKAFLI